MSDFKYRLGKKPKKHDLRTLQFKKYVQIAEPPASIDYSDKVTTWPMYGNDKYGDCTCAAVGHDVQLFTALAGTSITPSEEEILSLYFTLDNNGQPFAPGASEDEGAVELDVLNTWKKQGIEGIAPFAFVEVNPKSVNEVRTAIQLFAGLYIGVRLPLTAQGKDSWTGTVDPANGESEPGSWGGHAVTIIGYNPEGLTVVTWGKTLAMSWDFWMAYVDEAYAILPNDWQNVKAFDWSALQADLQSVSR